MSARGRAVLSDPPNLTVFLIRPGLIGSLASPRFILCSYLQASP